MVGTGLGDVMTKAKARSVADAAIAQDFAVRVHQQGTEWIVEASVEDRASSMNVSTVATFASQQGVTGTVIAVRFT